MLIVFESDQYSEIVLILHATRGFSGRSILGYFQVGKDNQKRFTFLFTRFFKTLYFDWFKKRKNPHSLKKLRVAFCGQEMITQKLNFFFYNLRKDEVEVENAPKSKIASLLLGHSVTVLTDRWLEKSIMGTVEHEYFE